MKVSVATFGCKVNQCDSEEIEQFLAGLGAEVVGVGQESDFLVVNGCAVTERAVSEARRFVRRMQRRFPDLTPVLTGCAARLGNDGVSVPGKAILAPHTKDLAAFFEPLGKRGQSAYPSLRRRTRAFVKVQDGCGEKCNFCVVPSVRGESRSLELSAALERVDELAGRGSREVVIVGTDLGDYGRGNSVPTDLAGLLRRIDLLPGEFRIRLSSIESRHLTPGLLNEFASLNRVCRHFHIPVQSGDDSILGMMGRSSSSSETGRRVGELQRLIPDASIGTDIIVGFPGEDEESFGRTARFVSEHPFSYFHVFPFSPRPGTPAYSMENRVPDAEKRRRASMLRLIGEEKRKEFAERFNGRTLQVVTLGDSPTDTGLTDNYIKVKLPAKTEANRLVEVLFGSPGALPAGAA